MGNQIDLQCCKSHPHKRPAGQRRNRIGGDYADEFSRCTNSGDASRDPTLDTDDRDEEEKRSRKRKHQHRDASICENYRCVHALRSNEKEISHGRVSWQPLYMCFAGERQLHRADEFRSSLIVALVRTFPLPVYSLHDPETLVVSPARQC
jgi:hypothetical protein